MRPVLQGALRVVTGRSGTGGFAGAALGAAAMICLAGCLGAGDDNAASVFPQDAAIEAQADAASSGGHDAGGPADARPPEAGDGGTGEASDGAGDAAGTAILSV